jgi:hypothetical protein
LPVSGSARVHSLLAPAPVREGANVRTETSEDVITAVLPDEATLVAAIPPDLAAAEPELLARIRLALLNAHVVATTTDIEAAVRTLRARAAGDPETSPFGPRFEADSIAELARQADEASAGGRLDLTTVLSLLYASGTIAATHGRRLIVFLSLGSEMRRILWDRATAALARENAPPERYIELGRRLLLWVEMSALAIGEGYRDTERELLARDAAAQRAAIDELLGSVAVDARGAARVRRLAMRYGLDPDTAYRVAALLPAAELDPTPDLPGIDDVDLDEMARRLDQQLRRPTGRAGGAGTGIRLPFAVSWRGSIVALLPPEPREWQRLQAAIRTVLAAPDTAWTAIATRLDGVGGVASALRELQEGLRVADGLGIRGVIDDLAELGIERLLLSDPALASTVIDRELGPLLADPRMGEELVETLQTFFDAGENRRETARRLHLADRTVTYRLERAETLLGHGIDGEAGRRLNLALTLRRLEAQRSSPRGRL